MVCQTTTGDQKGDSSVPRIAAGDPWVLCTANSACVCQLVIKDSPSGPYLRLLDCVRIGGQARQVENQGLGDRKGTTNELTSMHTGYLMQLHT